MKLILSALSVAFLSGSLAFAEGDGCKGKKDCDKTQKDESTLVPCDKHQKDGDDTKKNDAQLAGADCGKCKKDGDDTKKDEAQLS